MAGFFITRYWPRPDPGEPQKVTEHPAASPGPGQINSQGSGHLSGTVSLSQNTPKNPEETISNNDFPDKMRAKKQPSWTFYDADKITVPVQGEIRAKYYNQGRQIGEGSHDIIGTTEIKFTGSGLMAETTFKNDFNFSVEVSQPPPKTNHIGLYIVTDLTGIRPGGYYQHDWQLFGNIEQFTRLEADKEIRLSAGLEFQF